MTDTPDEDLYPGQPTFTYKPDGGGDPIIFPAYSTILGEVDGKTFFEMLWEFRYFKVVPADQLSDMIIRSHAPEYMQRRWARLSDAEKRRFMDEWYTTSEDTADELPGPPPES